MGADLTRRAALAGLAAGALAPALEQAPAVASGPPPLLSEPPTIYDDSGRTLPRLARRGGSEVVRYWTPGPVLNQGQLPYCLAFSATATAMAGPKRATLTHASVGNRYAIGFAERLQVAPQDQYTLGVSRGMWGSYAKIESSVEALRDAVVHVGPVDLSIPWYESMFHTNRGGVLAVRPHPAPGYHAVTCIGYHPAARLAGGYRGPAFRIRNSWGKGWGLNGDAWIAAPGIHRLFTPFGVPSDYVGYVALDRPGTTIAALSAAHPDPRVS